MRLIIRDGTEPDGRGGLDFDLRDILETLGRTARVCTWRGSDIQYISRDERDVAPIEALAKGNAVSGDDLIDGIGQLSQIIDGQFEGTEPDSSTPLVIIRAIDSSWWEVLSDDETVLGAVRRRFRAIEEAGSKPI
jgi:hypothetical protein